MAHSLVLSCSLSVRPSRPSARTNPLYSGRSRRAHRHLYPLFLPLLPSSRPTLLAPKGGRRPRPLSPSCSSAPSSPPLRKPNMIISNVLLIAYALSLPAAQASRSSFHSSHARRSLHTKRDPYPELHHRDIICESSSVFLSLSASRAVFSFLQHIRLSIPHHPNATSTSFSPHFIAFPRR